MNERKAEKVQVTNAPDYTQEVARYSAAHGYLREPKGVGGWLVIFILTAAIVRPLVTIGSLRNFWNSYHSPVHTPVTRAIDITQTIAYVFIGCLGIYAGISLVRVGRHAVRDAKRFLVAIVIHANLVLLVFSVLLGRPLWTSAKWNSGLLYRFVQALIYFSIWYLYLVRSRRVANTYGAGAKESWLLPSKAS